MSGSPKARKTEPARPGRKAPKGATAPGAEPTPAEPPDTTGGGTGTPLLKRVAPSSGSDGAKKG